MMRKKNPLELKSHPLNYSIYGKEPVDEQLKESIEKHGILVPLVILEDGTIISGHRRWKAALKVEPLPTLPCEVVGFASEEEEQLHIIEYNIYRKKTDVQIMKEGEILERIYKKQAEERKLKNLKQNQESTTEGANVAPSVSYDKNIAEKPEDDKGLKILEQLPTAELELPTAELEVDKPGKTTAKIAEDLQVSERKYKRIQRVRKARDSDDPAERQIYQEFEKGDVTANKAETKLREVRNEKESKVNPKLEFLKNSTRDENPKVAAEAEKLIKLVDNGIFIVGTAYNRLQKFINQELRKEEKSVEKGLKEEIPQEPTLEKPKGVLARGTVKKMIQTKLDNFQTRVTQVNPNAVKFLQEYFEEKAEEVTRKAAKSAEREDRKTIEESDIRRALKIPVK